ncbi:MAG: hypothetical protein SFX74_12375 [Fimbriimonadaceae bacterium]|nr:hypothetical protein [Fimbriimonadaceae bacterium]
MTSSPDRNVADAPPALPGRAEAGQVQVGQSPLDQAPAGFGETYGPITVVSQRTRRDFENGTLEFTGGVVVYYGPTRIEAETIRVQLSESGGTADASGKVAIIDPEGTLSAENLHVVWGQKDSEAIADRVNGQIAGAVFKAARMELRPGLWTFTDVEGTVCHRLKPSVALVSPKLTIVPGKSGRVDKPGLVLFGRKIGSVPSQSFNLDRRAQGIGYPSIGARQGEGFGISWGGNIFLNDQTALGVSFAAFRASYPVYGVTWAQTRIDPNKTEARAVPRDELADRFHVGWFDSVEIRAENSDARFFGEKRQTFAISSSANSQTANFDLDLQFTKPLELALESSDRRWGGSLYGQARLQMVGNQNQAQRMRSVFSATYVPGSYRIARNLNTIVRFDQQGIVGAKTSGWTRAQLGLGYRPDPRFGFGLAYILGRDYGNADFVTDRLYARNGWHLRASANFGGTRVEYLYKYDGVRQWYDREYSIYQAIGCIDIYLTQRQFPREYRLGFKFRIDPFIDLIQRRKQTRTKPVGPTIISSPDKP